MAYDGPEDAAEAFESANWNRMLPDLLQFAKSCLSSQGIHERATRRSGILQAEELVNEAVAELLGGERTWVPAEAKNEKGLVAVICMTMRSIAGNTRKSAAVARRTGGEKGERHIARARDEAPNPEDDLAGHELVREVENALQDDAEARRLLDAYGDGMSKRAEIAKATGFGTTQKVKTVRMRMMRTLASKGIAWCPQRANTDGEDES